MWGKWWWEWRKAKKLRRAESKRKRESKKAKTLLRYKLNLTTNACFTHTRLKRKNHFFVTENGELNVKNLHHLQPLQKLIARTFKFQFPNLSIYAQTQTHLIQRFSKQRKWAPQSDRSSSSLTPFRFFFFSFQLLQEMGARCSKFSFCWFHSHLKPSVLESSDLGISPFYLCFFSHFPGSDC